MNKPIIDIDYMDEHKDDSLPFEIGLFKHKRHLLHNDVTIFLSTTIQKAEITIDRDLVKSDYI